jgi:alkylation response protein AidB-like acyl-CoA dehydrogenase
MSMANSLQEHVSNDEETAYEELAARFRPVFARIAEGAVERETNRVLPFEPVQWLNEARFGALRVPVEYGGFGASYLTLFRLLIELAQADSNVAHLYRSHIGFLETVSRKDEDIRRRWYPRMAEGRIVGNASTERGGNLLGETNTKITRSGDRWVVNGEKFYSTGSIFADWIQVTAQIPGEEGRFHAIVAARQPGVEIRDDWDGFGQQLTGTGTTVFTDALAEDVFPRPVADTYEPAVFQLVLLAVQAGIGRAVLAEVSELVRNRTRSFNTGTGGLIREDPLILQLVGQISAKSYAAEQLVLAAARELDTVLDPRRDLSAAERYTRSELAVQKAQLVVPVLVNEIAGQLFDTLGASATSQSKKLDRYWRNARTVATHNPAVFKARIVGDYEVNGTRPVGLNAIGTVPGQHAN